MSYNILVVDDSKTVRRMIDKTLGLAGIPLNQVHFAQNGREALDLLETEWIDLMLTDINMPEMDGIELVRIMAEKGMMESVPVVVISTEGSDKRIEKLKGYGVRGYLRKPVTPEGIKTIIEGILGDQP